MLLLKYFWMDSVDQFDALHHNHYFSSIHIYKEDELHTVSDKYIFSKSFILPRWVTNFDNNVYLQIHLH